MSQHNSLVYLCLPEPRALLAGGEYLDCDVLASPPSTPDLPETTLTYYVH